MSKSLSYVPTSQNGKIEISPTYSDSNSSPSPIASVYVIMNKVNGANTPFIRKAVVFKDSDDVLLTKYYLDSTYLDLGAPTTVRLIYVLEDNTNVSSAVQILMLDAVASAPVLSDQFVRAGDASIFIDLNAIVPHNTNADGFNDITRVSIYLSEVGSVGAHAALQDDIAVTVTNGKYNAITTSTTLNNAKDYEVAIHLTNGRGDSDLSNTLTLTPTDTPDIVPAILAVNNLNALSHTVSWDKPNDFDSLAGTDNYVNKYTVHRYETVYNDVGAYWDIVAASHVATHLPITDGVEPSFASSGAFDYAKTLAVQSSELGKTYIYKVSAWNAKGESLPSASSLKVQTLSSPSPQPFDIHRVKSNAGVYLGDANLTLTGLSELNGGAEPLKTKVTRNGSVGYNYTLVLQILLSGSDIFSAANVIFVQEYTDKTVGSTTTTTFLNSWKLAPATVTLNGNTSLLAFMQDISNQGMTLDFQLFRSSKDINDNSLLSVATAKSLTLCANPEAITDITALCVEDNGVICDNKIRVLFNQLASSAMNGMDAISGTKKYILFMDHHKNQEVAHDSDVGTTAPIELSVAISASQIGVPHTFHIVAHYEAGSDILLSDSSRQVSESSKTSPAPVSELSATCSADGTAITATWRNPMVHELGGWPASVVKHFLFAVSAKTGSILGTKQTFTQSSGTQTATFTSATPSDAYVIYASTVADYTKAKLVIADGDYFPAAPVGASFASFAIVAAGQPNQLQNVELLSTDKNIEALFDASSTLNGVLPTDPVIYNIYTNKESMNATFPYNKANPASPHDALLPTVGITSDMPLTMTTVFKALLAKQQSPLSVQDKVFAIFQSEYTVTRPIAYKKYTDANSVVVNGATAVSWLKDLTTSLTAVPPSTVKSEPTSEISTTLYGVAPSATGVSATGASNKVTILVEKQLDISDLLIKVDNDDGLDNTQSPIAEMNTSLGTQSLVKLENSFNAGSLQAPFNAGGFDFKVLAILDKQYYSVTFNNLVNGRIHEFAVRQIINGANGAKSLSVPVKIDAMAQAAPTDAVASKFVVASNAINVKWGASTNAGGAGKFTNGPLMYVVSLMNASTDAVLAIKKTSALSTVFTDLTNWSQSSTELKVFVTATYSDAEDQLFESPGVYAYAKGDATNPNIRVGSGPSPLVVDLVAGDQQVTGSITVGDSTEVGNYPISSFKVYTQTGSDISTRSTVLQTITPANSAPSFAANAVLAITAISGLTNGRSVRVVVVATSDYEYAQAPSDFEQDMITYGAMSAGVSPEIGSNGKALVVVLNMNGHSLPKHIVALGKSDDSTAVVVKSLSQQSLPAFVLSGPDSQTATFNIDFAQLLGSTDDALFIIVSNQGSLTVPYPATLSYFA